MIKDPIVLYDNIYGSNVQASGTDAAIDFNVLHLLDDRYFTLWQAPAVGTYYITQPTIAGGATAEALMLFGHNLGTIGAQVSVESSTDAFAGVVTERVAPFTPDNDELVLKLFTAAADPDWRLKISAPAGIALLGVLRLGMLLKFPHPTVAGQSPHTEDPQTNSATGGEGGMLGVSTTWTKITASPRFDELPAGFVADEFYPFWANHAKLRRGFCYCWNYEDYPEFAFWMRHTGKYSWPKSLASRVDSITMPMEGRR